MTPKAKKIHIILAGVLILFIGVGIGFWMGKVKYSIPIGRQAENKNSNAISETGKSETKDGGEGDFVGEYKVSRVIDGDTIEIEGGERVRYIGIDTPETVDPRKPVQCFGVEASNKNKEMVVGKTVRLEKDTTDRDKYKRLLRYVYVGDTFINLEMVKQGFAYSYSYPPDIKFQKEILAAQQEAEKNKNGLWNACPLDAGRSATARATSKAIFPPAMKKSIICPVAGHTPKPPLMSPAAKKCSARKPKRKRRDGEKL